jgi:DNA-binding XRE family transcriptional regulator
MREIHFYRAVGGKCPVEEFLDSLEPKQAQKSPGCWDYDSGNQDFKVGVLLRQAREQPGITQEDRAPRTKTKKSAISRLENHAEDMRLSTLNRVARALGKNLRIELVAK